MNHYSDELKASVIARMLSPNNGNVMEISKETGIPKDTLYTWRLKARGKQPSFKVTAGYNGFSSEDKFEIVVETASMNQEELSAFCRKKGVFPQHIEIWRRQCSKANETNSLNKVDREKARQQEKEIKQLKTELRRKEKALAETAALLVLKKKAQELWGDPEDDI